LKSPLTCAEPHFRADVGPVKAPVSLSGIITDPHEFRPI
jgi:hypothetical protein